MACSHHLCTANDPDPVRNQNVVSPFELDSAQPIECELKMDGAPYLPRFNHVAAALPPGKPQPTA
jgi:hypothetical protein